MISATHIRRTAAGATLFGAALMMILGLTVYGAKLKGYHFVTYWGACFGLTLSSAILALADVAAIRRESRRAQQALLEETMQQVEEERRKRIAGEQAGSRRPATESPPQNG